MKHITDGKGKWIGHIEERSDSTIYSNAKGQVMARVINDKTFDAKGKYEGTGDQGIRLIKNK
jgi:hypothetical protein